MRRILVAALRAYQYLLSPWWGRHCRFEPTCSHYAIEAIEQHGAGRGFLLSAGRICRCHPWSAGGFDPVPANGNATRTSDRAAF